MLVGGGGMHATSLLVVRFVPVVEALLALVLELDEPLLPQAASTTIERTANPIGRHLVQVRIVRSSSSLVTQYGAPTGPGRPRTAAGWADPGGAQPATTNVSGEFMRVK